ncbi:TorF family putative porin [Pseudoalteromonas obscura]|uniref:TorF family putative porin n=1 Tax=Pseudoalteromonas obscura TaxID=3048491 RepID=A0ABT7ENU0_9GAMM|nr:TorF family putative porin [Pseudoalteromonas sp. P94(2023)]MDK2596717.1 TorF family putative porin [Pseudoalteromonas sp. P94(2023)]
MKKNLRLTLCTLSVLFASNSVIAGDWSSTITGASDYTFNGISQTDNDFALQASLDYSNSKTNWYAGSWASNVDFSDGTDTEVDVYFGRTFSLTDAVSLDVGIAYYSYYGGDDSSDLNYPEAYTKFGFDNALGTTEFNFWYSWDYAGQDEKHTITTLSHTFEVAENHDILVSYTVSNYVGGDVKWDETNSSYHHYEIAYSTSLSGFDLSIAAEDTSIDSDTSDERIAFSVSRTFDL